MRPALLLFATATMVVACDNSELVAPRLSTANVPRAAVTSANVLAWEHCTWWDPGIPCTVQVSNADGSQSSYGPEYHNPTWAPDGTRIAVDSYSEIVVVNLSDGSTTALTANAGYNSEPSWSPDGTRIAFGRYTDADGAYELYLMNADGSGVQQVTNNVGFAGRPQWFPDGSRLVFTCTVDAGNRDICAIAADGGAFTRLTNDPADDYDAAVSPDGARIAFTTDRASQGTNQTLIATMNLDGSDVVVNYGLGYARDAAWSSDGRMSFTGPYNGACNADWSDSCADRLYVEDGYGNIMELGVGSRGVWRPVSDATDQPPVAKVSVSSCQESLCSFTASGSADDRLIVGYGWDFGDGTQRAPDAYSVSVQHLFTASGTYTVKLTVADGAGQTATESIPVTVVHYDFTAKITSTCNLLQCTFSASQSHGFPTVTYDWKFGDGSSAVSYDQAGVTHTYSAAGSYAVTLTAHDRYGQTATDAVTLTVTSDTPPVAQFSASCAGLTCSFDSRPSSDDHGIVSRSWNFGDGSSASNLVSTTHKYPEGGGKFSVILTVRDGAGQSATSTVTVTAIDQAPVAKFTYSCAGTQCTFDATSSSDDVGIKSYKWDFGNLGLATGSVVKLAVKGKTTFTAKLTVADGAGNSTSATQTVTTK